MVSLNMLVWLPLMTNPDFLSYLDGDDRAGSMPLVANTGVTNFFNFLWETIGREVTS